MEKIKAISVNNLEIKYKDVKKISLKRNGLKSLKSSYYVAIENVSFDIYKGEIVGICGKNGSGKSTLLRALAGIFSPDKGEINLYNNTISLLSIGVGFQKNLSGKENIFLSGLLLGFSEKQIEDKYDEIVEFSTLKEVIEKPVSSYSSGMYSKLAFAITAILETDIVLIDEVLSVGDVSFKEKSYKKMKSLISDANRTVVIVSHNGKTLVDLCTKAIWIHDGKIKDVGDPKVVVKNYEDYIKNK